MRYINASCEMNISEIKILCAHDERDVTTPVTDSNRVTFSDDSRHVSKIMTRLTFFKMTRFE